MAGFNLKEGKYETRNVSEDELWSALANIFTSKSKNDTSYKYGFFKAILDNLDNVDKDLILTFDQLFTRFTEIYWLLITQFNLRQKAAAKDNRRSAIEKVLIEAKNNYEISENQAFDTLPPKVRSDISHQVKMKCKTYVVGAFYEDTKRLFYSFSKKDGWIQLNPRMYDFLCARKAEIEKMNTYEWAHFIETNNKDYCANYILLDSFNRSKSSNINTFEVLLEVETAEQGLQYSDTMIQKESSLHQYPNSTNEKIDEDIIALLDNPEQLIKLLKKKLRS